MDNVEAVNAMRDMVLVKGRENRMDPQYVLGRIMEIKIVGPDEVAAVVMDYTGKDWECWPEDLEILDPITQEWDDYHGIVRNENMDIIE